MTTLSASSVSTYEECHLQWYFEYVEMLEQPFNEPRDTGIKVHDYAEWALKIASGEWPESERLVGVSEDVKVLIDLFRSNVMPTYGNVVLVEAAFELDVEGITYTGFIDSVDVHEGSHFFSDGPDVGFRTTLRDLKTTKNRPRAGKYRNNMIGYYLGARVLGHEPDSLLLDYLIRTKTPYYWPEWQEVPDEDEIDIWVSNVERVASGIERGDYSPTGVGTYVCNYCPFKDICGPHQRFLELSSVE